MKYILAFLGLCLGLVAQAETVSDWTKESRWAAQIEDALLDGEAVWITEKDVKGPHKFMGIYTPATDKTKRTAIVVHGLGAHADWPEVVQPLRVGLTEQGWNTLSIQVPVLGSDKKAEDYVGLFPQAAVRIASAAKYLKAQGLTPSVLVTHSLGSVMGAYYLANHTHSFERFVAVGMPEGAVQYLSKVTIPVVDIYGSEDIPSVLQSVAARKNAYLKSEQYTQVKVDKADHMFTDRGEDLVVEVVGWLKK